MSILISVQTNISNKTAGVDLIFIGVHVRRGDFVGQHRRGYTTPEAAYYLKAMTLFSSILSDKLPVFIVCSDEIAWAKSKFAGFSFTIRYMSSTHTPEVDMAILSQCNHTIMSSGTFSWWAAFLANGITMYYENYPGPGTAIDLRMHRQDYYFPQWIPLK